MSAVAASDVVSLFTELAVLPSPSTAERKVADRVIVYLRALDLQVDEDDAGERLGSTMGNLYCRLEPTEDGGTPVFLCAHLDTVPPTAAIDPTLDDGVIRNAGGTILGADNKSAVAVMLEAARRVVEEKRPHAGVELLFTPMEEVGLRGAEAFDHTRFRASVGFVYDHAAPVGDVVLGAPHQRKIDVEFHGRAAHSGMYPEEGRSAIAAAGRAIADLRLGRLDDETTANVGQIAGGTARNVIPDHCTFTAEARSHDERKLAEVVQEMLDTITFAAGTAECDVETRVEQAAHGYRFRKDDFPVRLACAALERSGFTPRLILSGGGADANVFNERALQCLNLANGMENIHTPDEQIAVADLEAMVEVTLALIDEARAANA
jgi:tripeptide aminopeptidase